MSGTSKSLPAKEGARTLALMTLTFCFWIYLLFDYWLYVDLPRGILG